MDCINIVPLSKPLYNLRLLITHSHTIGDWLPCKVPTSSSGAIGGYVICSGTLRHAQGGIEPATLRLPDDSSYFLSQSHIAPSGSGGKSWLTMHSDCPGSPTALHRDMLKYTADVRDWMAADPNNIIAIHCKGGKGEKAGSPAPRTLAADVILARFTLKQWEPTLFLENHRLVGFHSSPTAPLIQLLEILLSC